MDEKEVGVMLHSLQLYLSIGCISKLQVRHDQIDRKRSIQQTTIIILMDCYRGMQEAQCEVESDIPMPREANSDVE